MTAMTEKLSEMMIDTPSALAHWVACVPSPENYYRGVSSRLTHLPRNVLAFSRHGHALADNPLDIHSRYVLILAVTGAGSVIVDGQLHPLAEGEALLLLPYQSHYYAPVDRERLCWLFLTFEQESPEALVALRHAPLPLSSTAMAQVQRLIHTYCHGAAMPLGRDDVPLLLAWVLAYLLDRRAQNHGEARPAPTLYAEHTMIAAVCQYIYAHLHEPLPLADIAAIVAISVSHLRALFRRAVGVSLGAFIRQARLHTAHVLLTTTTMRVSEIAVACGYASPYAFTRAFAQVWKMSPRQCRQQQRAGC